LAYLDRRDENFAAVSIIKGSWMEHRATRNLWPPGTLACAVALLLLGGPLRVFADKESDVVALETQCEAERQARIRPLREMEIAKCKEESHNDAAYCQRFWKDYGNAVRTATGGTVPRMFDDLPVCVAAFKARKALADDAR
jgi:hypothetical protein